MAGGFARLNRNRLAGMLIGGRRGRFCATIARQIRFAGLR